MNFMNCRCCYLLLVLGVTLSLNCAHAERADKDKPMLIEADRVSIDDAQKVQILEGRVIVSKGTMRLEAARVLISENAQGFQKGVAYGAPGKLAKFRQKREGLDEYFEGEAERIEYDTSNEVAELFHRAWVKSGQDEVRGDYIWYDAINEKYLVTATAPSAQKGGESSRSSRVRAIIQPRNQGDTGSSSGTAAVPPSAADKMPLKSVKELQHEPAQR